MRIATLKLPNGTLGFEVPVTLETARIYWRTWTPAWFRIEPGWFRIQEEE